MIPLKSTTSHETQEFFNTFCIKYLDLESDGDRLLFRAPGLEDLDLDLYCLGGFGRSVTAGRIRSFDADRERDGATFGLGGGVFFLGGEGVGLFAGKAGGGVGDFLGGGEYLSSGLGSGGGSTRSGFFSGVVVSGGLVSTFFSATFFPPFANVCFADDLVVRAEMKEMSKEILYA